jgi:PiT family inorganic phosphate transporter
VEPIPLIITGIIVALFFDFVNGFHDAANAIATVVGTRVLKPIQAVGMAALANFIGPFVFGTAIAATVGKGIIQPNFSTAEVILAGLVGAIAWDLLTWYFGLPSSSFSCSWICYCFGIWNIVDIFFEKIPARQNKSSLW